MLFILSRSAISDVTSWDSSHVYQEFELPVLLPIIQKRHHFFSCNGQNNWQLQTLVNMTVVPGSDFTDDVAQSRKQENSIV